MNRKIVLLVLVSMLLLPCTMTGHEVVMATANRSIDDGSSIGLSGDNALINPLPGQYADYSIKYYGNGKVVSGWWNFSYLGYIEPDLINVTHTIAGPDPSMTNGVFWMIINTTNRRVVDGNHWWKDSCYLVWMETGVSEGSVVRISTVNATVVKSETVTLKEMFVDCWPVNWTQEFETKNNYMFLFDKITGLCIIGYAFNVSMYIQTVMVTLVSTNIPIGVCSPSHELGISFEVPVTLRPNESALVNVTVRNYGVDDETNMEVQLLVDGVLVNSTHVPFLANGSFVKLTYVWIPPSESIYNITAYVSPVPGETFIENNRVTELVRVPTTPEVKVGVKTGDWIKYDYVITGQPQGTILPQWIKIEFLSVEGTSASVLATMHLSNGTEQNQTMLVDIVSGGGALVTFSGIIIPSNLMVGDSIYMSGYGYVTIEKEYEKTYVGVTRRVLSKSFSQQGISLTYYWDKQTGVLVEASSSFPQLNITAIAKATETNMWQANTIVRLKPSEVSVPVGATFTVDVTITNVTDLCTWQIEMFFDPEVLNCTGAWYPVDHVFAEKEIVSVDPVIENAEGYVLYGCCLLGDEETFNGKGTLCEIQFTAVSPGKTALVFSGPEDTFLLDHNLNEIPYGAFTGISAVEGLYCDLNNDQRIDIADISAAAQAFCSYPGHPRWSRFADINQDNKVDIVDLVLVAKNWTAK